MMKKIVLFAFAIVSFALISSVSLADKVMFFTPTRVLLDDQKKVEVMNITNLSDITRSYKISMQDQVMTYQGITASVDNFEYSAKRMLRFVPREFTLAPGERQTIRIMSRLRPETKEGEYHTHIRFLEDVSQRQKNNPPTGSQAASISAPLAYEALIPAVVSHGNVNTTIALKDAKILKASDGSAYKVDLVLSRAGNGQGTAYVDTHYVAPDGTMTAVTPRRTVYLYREIDERIKDYEFTLASDLKPGGAIKISVYDKPEKGANVVNETTLNIP